MTPELRNELKGLIKEVVAETVPAVTDAVLERFGFTVEDVPAMQHDMAHLRKSREGTEKVKSAVVSAAIGTAIAGGLWVFWEGLKLAVTIKTGAPH